MALVGFLSSSALAEARLRDALSEEHRLRKAESWQGLLRLLRETRVDACIVDVDFPGREIGLADLARIRSEHPLLAMVACGSFQSGGMDLFRLGRVGVDDLLLAEEGDDPERIREAVVRALMRALATRVEERLDENLPPLGLQALRWSIEHAHLAPQVADLAEALHLHPRTLSRHLRKAGLPPAGRLLLWGRMFQAARLLEDPSTTVESVAYRLSYSSAAALRRALKRETGMPPTDLANRGGVLWVLDAFFRTTRRWGSSPPRGLRAHDGGRGGQRRGGGEASP